MENRRYYWIKLKTDFFDRDEIDFILSQKNGCEYIVLYQMLCMKSVNNEGVLGTRVNEIIIPYDINKIVRDTKYFDYDTVAVALELYKKLGLVYEDDGKVLKITDYSNMVGSETASTIRSRKCRENQKVLQGNKDATQLQRKCNIDIDIDKEIDIDIYNNKEDNNKINKKESDSEIITNYYQQEMGQLPSPNQYEKLYYYLDKLDVSLIKNAIDEAVNRNKKNMAYIEAILKDYVNKGYKSIDDLPNSKEEPIEDDYVENEDLKELEDFDWLNS